VGGAAMIITGVVLLIAAAWGSAALRRQRPDAG
jgi:hypothetical protein